MTTTTTNAAAPTIYRVRHSYGGFEDYLTYEDALDALRDIYGDDIVTAGDFGDSRPNATMVWCDEIDAELEDGSTHILVWNHKSRADNEACAVASVAKLVSSVE